MQSRLPHSHVRIVAGLRATCHEGLGTATLFPSHQVISVETRTGNSTTLVDVRSCRQQDWNQTEALDKSGFIGDRRAS